MMVKRCISKTNSELPPYKHELYLQFQNLNSPQMQFLYIKCNKHYSNKYTWKLWEKQISTDRYLSNKLHPLKVIVNNGL